MPYKRTPDNGNVITPTDAEILPILDAVIATSMNVNESRRRNVGSY